MEDLKLLGNKIKEKRLALNMRMDDLAKKARITRSTLWAIEKGRGNYSINTLLSLLNILGLSINIDNSGINKSRNRASRINSKADKNINSFIIMCVEQYAAYSHSSSQHTYKILLDKGIINELKNDYEDLHGMSTEYLNDYFDDLLEARQ